MKLPLDRARAALANAGTGELPPYLDVSIDTRTLAPGQTYLALDGENFDGHRFLAAARERGAVAAIVSDPRALDGLPGFVVGNTRTALLALGAAMRDRFCGGVVAITGSAGKTTTKAFLAQLLTAARIGEIVATPANENNEIGVSKVLLSLDAQAAAVIEMGARNPDDIAPLVTAARPHIAVLTNIGDAHVGVFGSQAELARTKWQLFSTGARAVLALSDATSRERAALLAEPPLFCGIAGDAPIDGARMLVITGDALVLREPGGSEERAQLAKLPDGAHNVRNLAAACAAALLLGVPLATVARSAAGVQAPPGRYERIITPQAAAIIHDAYNASPSGTVATLEAFAREPGRKIVVLSSMAELGADAPAGHRRVGAAVASIDAHLILFGGAHREDLLAGAREAGVPAERIELFAENADAVVRLRSVLQSGDVVVVKGSRMYRLEEIVEALAGAGAPAA